MKAKEMKHDWLKSHAMEYSYTQNELFLKEIEDSGWEIQRYDNRKKSGQPDSYVITVRKP